MENSEDPRRKDKDAHLNFIGCLLCNAIDEMHDDIIRNFPYATELYPRPKYQQVLRLRDRYGEIVLEG